MIILFKIIFCLRLVERCLTFIPWQKQRLKGEEWQIVIKPLEPVNLLPKYLKDNLTIVFEAFKEKFELRLVRNSALLKPTFLVISRRQNQAKVEHISSNDINCIYSGKVIGKPGSLVSLSACDRLTGTILTSDNEYVIEPISLNVQSKLWTPVIIHKRPLVNISEAKNTNNSEMAGNSDCSFAQPDNCPDVYLEKELNGTLEIAIFLEKYLLEDFHSENRMNIKDILLYILAYINMIQLKFQHPSLQIVLNLVTARVELLYTHPYETNLNNSLMFHLQSFCRWQAKINPAINKAVDYHWDHSILFASESIFSDEDRPFSGMSFPGKLCDQLYGCTIVKKYKWSSNLHLIHELGHSIGFGHIPRNEACADSYYIMSQQVHGKSHLWTSCDVSIFKKVLNSRSGQCLQDKINDYSFFKPGSVLTASEQCALIIGHDFKAKLTHLRKICHELICEDADLMIYKIKAFEETPCGKNMWCKNNICQYRDEYFQTETIWSNWINEDSCYSSCLANAISLKKRWRVCSLSHQAEKLCEGKSIDATACNISQDWCLNTIAYQDFITNFCSFMDLSTEAVDNATIIRDSPCIFTCFDSRTKIFKDFLSPDGVFCNDTSKDLKFCLAGSCHSIPEIETSILCPEPSPPLHGSYTLALPFTEGSSLYFFCDYGYLLNDSSEIQCTSLGIWNNSFPICKENFCYNPKGIENGFYKINGIAVPGVKAVYSCNPGYMMKGWAEKKCLENLQWEGDDPICLKITTTAKIFDTSMEKSSTSKWETTSTSPSIQLTKSNKVTTTFVNTIEYQMTTEYDYENESSIKVNKTSNDKALRFKESVFQTKKISTGTSVGVFKSLVILVMLVEYVL